MPRHVRLPASKAEQVRLVGHNKTDVYSTIEAAALLGVTFQTVARWMDRGFLNGRRTPGGHRLIDAASLNEMLRKGRNKSAQTASSASNGISFLLVDDSEDELMLLRQAVLDAYPDAKIDSAHNAFDALVSIGRDSPDVLITDILMPGIDGIEMIRSLREGPLTRNLLILAVSSYPESALAQRFAPLPEGVCFLSKPVASESLRNVVSQARAAAT